MSKNTVAKTLRTVNVKAEDALRGGILLIRGLQIHKSHSPGWNIRTNSIEHRIVQDVTSGLTGGREPLTLERRTLQRSY